MPTLYPDSELPWRSVTIADAHPKVDRPPTPADGDIASVELDYRNELGENTFVRCAHCSTSIEYAAPHVRAIVNLYGDEAWPHGTWPRAHFCDRECWASWASSSS